MHWEKMTKNTMEIFTLFPCVSNPFSFLWLYRKKAENPTLPFWPETSHFRQIFPAFRFCLIFSWSLKLFLAKERLCFLCLTTPVSKIFCRFPVVSQPFFPLWHLSMSLRWFRVQWCTGLPRLCVGNGILEEHILKIIPGKHAPGPPRGSFVGAAMPLQKPPIFYLIGKAMQTSGPA